MRVLMLTHRLPYAPNRGDRIRAFHLLKSLAAHHQVTLMSLTDDAREIEAAGEIAARLAGLHAFVRPARRNMVRALVRLAGSMPLTHVLLDTPALDAALAGGRFTPPDVVIAYCTGIAPVALRPPLANYPLLLDMVDVDSAKWRSLADRGRGPMRWIHAREARTLAAFEQAVAARASVTTVVSEREREALQRLCPAARIEVVPNGVDLEFFAPQDQAAPEPLVVFVGVMNYPPNVDGARWLATEIWPRVLARVPSARLALVGADPVRAVRALAGPAIEVTGAVPDVRPWLWRASVAAAPLRTARGLQNKVLEALAAGVPVVATSAVLEGLPSDCRGACVATDDPAGFADALVTALNLDPHVRRTTALRSIPPTYAWGVRMERMVRLAQEVGSGAHLSGDRISQ